MCALCARRSAITCRMAGINVRREHNRKRKRTTDCVDRDQLRVMSICAYRGDRDAQEEGPTLFEPAAVAGSLVLNTTFLVGIRLQ
jgi:hypothetical protein